MRFGGALAGLDAMIALRGSEVADTHDSGGRRCGGQCACQCMRETRERKKKQHAREADSFVAHWIIKKEERKNVQPTTRLSRRTRRGMGRVVDVTGRVFHTHRIRYTAQTEGARQPVRRRVQDVRVVTFVRVVEEEVAALLRGKGLFVCSFYIRCSPFPSQNFNRCTIYSKSEVLGVLALGVRSWIYTKTPKTYELRFAPPPPPM